MNQNQSVVENNDDHQVVVDEDQKLKDSLPKSLFMGSEVVQLVEYEGFWYGDMYFQNILALQRSFDARDTDLIIASLPKTGTTWLKSLLFSIVNRVNYPTSRSPLLDHHPHDLVHSLEPLYGEAFQYPRPHHLDELPSPRLFSTHLSYTSLPESIKTSGCRILYICRNPLDTFVSMYYFSLSFMKKQFGEGYKGPSMEDFFEEFYDGRHPCGPFFEQALEYWKASLERPEKVLFLKYEDLKDDPTVQLTKVARFIGMPFSPEEESEGVIKEIIELCSIKSMKGLDANSKSEAINRFYEKKTFFRKGEVGDWTNHFTPTMVERMNKLMNQKLDGSSLSFQLLPK